MTADITEKEFSVSNDKAEIRRYIFNQIKKFNIANTGFVINYDYTKMTDGKTYIGLSIFDTLYPLLLVRNSLKIEHKYITETQLDTNLIILFQQLLLTLKMQSKLSLIFSELDSSTQTMKVNLVLNGDCLETYEFSSSITRELENIYKAGYTVIKGLTGKQNDI